MSVCIGMCFSKLIYANSNFAVKETLYSISNNGMYDGKIIKIHHCLVNI